uniref:Uncharacterized protein n=1 Tax=viral metagenome TaxID=1070528 RepID=A0A6M3X570_9ZZZZ
MPEKIEDRLFRLKCKVHGVEKKIAEIIRVMSDEQLEQLFDNALEYALQSGDIKIKESG